jgi:carboxymethylenebutenolidase
MNDIEQYFVEEFAEEYQKGRMSRRDLLRRVLLITGSAPLAAGALLAVGCGAKSGGQPSPSSQAVSPPNPPTTVARPSVTATTAAAAVGANTMPPAAQTTAFVVQPDDPAIRARNVQFPGPAGTVFGYLAQPASGTAAPGIVIATTNRGLFEPHQDIARRYAKEGFAALVVDPVSRIGGTASMDPAAVAAGFGRIGRDNLVADHQAGLAYLKTVDGVRGDRLGATGFCIGGSETFGLAVTSPEVLAAVTYYGTAVLDDLPKSKAAFLCFYGENDTRVSAQAPEVERVLKALGRPVEIHIEPGADHSFFGNDGRAYNPAAARDAWPRTIAWFNQYLKA